MTSTITRDDLLAVEDMPVSIAIAQVLRGEEPSPDTAIMAILALARLLGEHDWTKPGASEWYCQADAVGITTTHCSPENPIHSSPCGWMT